MSLQALHRLLHDPLGTRDRWNVYLYLHLGELLKCVCFLLAINLRLRIDSLALFADLSLVALRLLIDHGDPSGSFAFCIAGAALL